MERFTCETRPHPFGVEVVGLTPFVKALAAAQPDFGAAPEECVAIIHRGWRAPYAVMAATREMYTVPGRRPSEFCRQLAGSLRKFGKRKLARELLEWASKNIADEGVLS